MLEPAKIPLPKVRKSILIWGMLCCLGYVVLLFIMKFAGLMHVTALRTLNYAVLFVVCFIGIKRWVTQTEHYVPFLTVFLTSFITGVFSFVLFCIFLMFYTSVDAELMDLFREHAPATFRAVPSAVVLFEGSGISIIVAFINMQYFRRYEEGEVSPEKHPHTNKPNKNI